MRTSFIRTSLITLTLCGASPAFAEGTSAQRAACTPDVWRLCAGEIPNVSGITACLRREKPKLSPACRQVMHEADREAGTRPVASNERRS
ncbi:hypothetical protein [Methylobacterium frigidaeris]|uniref:3',5'-cyclic-nucleotide phosphodiesterase n=1 Tax=Methylobacterium frigidaeris TaxID=2038277 RepID=A0AA37H8Y6_9HYPH|nr:hypothetical protein [Methylobacterium frigidaeris]PIK70305.1 hypothetical protein CS379_25340 [Methylobacterium frigidaeris]GJD61174.1 hypothetical protein MPEAHAMD_1314 [Methylobacterium frigidaeris]